MYFAADIFPPLTQVEQRGDVKRLLCFNFLPIDIVTIFAHAPSLSLELLFAVELPIQPNVYIVLDEIARSTLRLLSRTR